MRMAWILAAAAVAVGLAALAADPDKPKADDKPPAGRRRLTSSPTAISRPATRTPTGWQTVDGLSSFWVKDDDPKHGKVIKFDTDV